MSQHEPVIPSLPGPEVDTIDKWTITLDSCGRIAENCTQWGPQVEAPNSQVYPPYSQHLPLWDHHPNSLSSALLRSCLAQQPCLQGQDSCEGRGGTPRPVPALCPAPKPPLTREMPTICSSGSRLTRMKQDSKLASSRSRRSLPCSTATWRVWEAAS